MENKEKFLHFVHFYNNGITATVDMPVCKALGDRPEELKIFFSDLKKLMSIIDNDKTTIDSLDNKQRSYLKSAILYSLQFQINDSTKRSLLTNNNEIKKRLAQKVEQIQKFTKAEWFRSTDAFDTPKLEDFLAPQEASLDMKKPAIFVASSNEGIEVARAIELQLSEDGEVTTWKDGVFDLSLGSLESLDDGIERFDFAVFVLTPDDLVLSREVTSKAPRDNVMLELGLFMGRLGRQRTFVVCSNHMDMKLPSDLDGVIVARYDANRSDGNLIAALGPACTLVRVALHEWGGN